MIHAIISLIIGYIGVLELGNEIVANIGFNTFHLDLAILLFYLSFQFNRRMFYLSTTRVKIELSKSHGDSAEFVEFSSITMATTTECVENDHDDDDDDDDENETVFIINDNNSNHMQYDKYDDDDDKTKTSDGQQSIQHIEQQQQQHNEQQIDDDEDYDNDNPQKIALKTNNHSNNKYISLKVKSVESKSDNNNDDNTKIILRRKQSGTESDSDSNNKRYRRHIYREDSIVSNREFLRIVTRSTLLLTWIIPFMLSISITWTLHRFVFDTTHFSMCIALLVMEIDAFIDIICVLLLFKYADAYYNGLCKCTFTNISCTKCGCHYFCNQCCLRIAKRYVEI